MTVKEENIEKHQNTSEKCSPWSDFPNFLKSLESIKIQIFNKRNNQSGKPIKP